MKVVHLCTQDFGGAGKAAYRLHKGLQSIDIDSVLLVLDKKSGDPSVKVIPEIQNSLTYCENPITIIQPEWHNAGDNGLKHLKNFLTDLQA